MTHFLYCPWTGLGLYNGFRGDRWLKNRIKIFKQFVVPSLDSQTKQDFILWCSWRPEERENLIVKEFVEWLEQHKKAWRVTHTFNGLCFWDDKYPDDKARDRLLTSLRWSLMNLSDLVDSEEVLMTIQPSDDCYKSSAVQEIQDFFNKNKDIQVFGYKNGYVSNYQTLEVAEWNPKTTPPFYTIRFPKDVFLEPIKHFKYTGPYKSHEYVKDFLPASYTGQRGFLVGTHGENISTIFNHPYTGQRFAGILEEFGLGKAKPLKLKYSLRKKLLSRFPYKVQRKLRFWAGEKNWLLRPLFSAFYNFMRS